MHHIKKDGAIITDGIRFRYFLKTVCYIISKMQFIGATKNISSYVRENVHLFLISNFPFRCFNYLLCNAELNNEIKI